MEIDKFSIKKKIILFDNQIFNAQKFGGISRYFHELTKSNNSSIHSFKRIENNVLIYPEESFFDNFEKKIKNKLNLKTSNQRSVKISKGLKNILQFDDYDVFHPTYYDPYFLEYVNKPFVLTVYDMIHEIYPEYFKLNDDTFFNKKILCEHASKIIAISETTKNDIINFYNIDPRKIVVTLLGSNFHLINDTPIDIDIERYMLYTGNRTIYKNFYFMVLNLVDLFKQDKNLKLICTGYDFNDLEILFLKQLGIYKNVIHIKINDDSQLSWLYKNAICFIFPSVYEGFGFPILEAFASGCPVVSSNGGSLIEIGGKAASFFNPKNSNEFKTKLTEVLYNKDIRDNMIENGFIEYKKYSWEKCRSETIKVYNSLI